MEIRNGALALLVELKRLKAKFEFSGYTAEVALLDSWIQNAHKEVKRRQEERDGKVRGMRA